MTGTVVYRDIKKSYGRFEAIKGVSLDVRESELISLLGPSGSGKTTLLMMLAGLETPSSGDILVDGQSIVNVPVNKRNLGMVFQRYTLFPHMSVAENVAFPLTVRGISRSERDEKVARILDVVQLGAFAHRKPSQLSGGQQQRVALARALVYDPPVVLMDEPFAALDRKLRIEMQEELRGIRDKIGVTIIFVTHDQEEALRISDRVAILNDGILQQIGFAREIYDLPDNEFVAAFIGNTNLLDARIVSQDDDGVELQLSDGGLLAVSKTSWRANGIEVGKPVRVAIRPEMLKVETDGAHPPALRGVVSSSTFLGEDSTFHMVGDSGEVKVSVPFGGVVPKENETVGLGLRTRNIPVFPAAKV